MNTTIPVIEKEIDYVRVPIFRIVKTGSRHNLFKIQINCLMYLNPEISLLQLQSFINFWNQHMTDEQLAKKDMMNMVRREFEGLKSGGENIAGIRKKYIHTNPNRSNRKAIANEMVAKRKVEKSLKIIQSAVDALNYSNKKISLKNVAELTEGLIGIRTI